MKTDHLDLWQVHDVRTDEDIKAIFGPDGALEAFVEARDKGLVRFIGVTGHQNPTIIKRCIEKYNFDTVLMPVNPAEPAYKSFIDEVLPLARSKGMGVIAMKLYFRGLAVRIPGVSTLEPFYRFALSHEVDTAVIGCDDVAQLENNVSFAGSFEPMSDGEIKELVDRVSPYADRLMYYKRE